MDLSPDWIELLELLNEKRVEYMVVGAHALAFHGMPRYTGDLDIFVSASSENAKLLYDALVEFGAPVSSLSEATLAESDTMITFGIEPRAVDILNWLTGVTWEDAASDAVDGQFGSVPVRFISARAYKKNKAASGRPKDLADLDYLS